MAVAVPTLEKAYRWASIASFVASFGFGVGILLRYTVRSAPWTLATIYGLGTVYLLLFLGSVALFCRTSKRIALNEGAEATRRLLRPSLWMFAGQLNLALQVAGFAVWLDLK